MVKTVICDCSGDTCTMPGTGTSSVVPGWVGTWVGIAVGYWEGYTGYYPPTARGGLMTAKRAPEAPGGLEWVVMRLDACLGGWTVPSTTLRARSGTRPLPVLGTSECRLLANRGEN